MIRWKCVPCSKTWIYPVSKCLYCKGNITRQKTEANKVIAASKVVVPSPLHPIVPYNVLLLEDEFGNRIPRKTIKSYKAGDRFSEENAKSDNAVSIVKIKYDVLDAVEHAMELINFSTKENPKVLIKPNIEVAAYPYQAATTNPKVLDAVIQVLLGKNVPKENITVAEQAVFGEDTTAAAARAGIIGVCKKQGVIFTDLSKTEFAEKQIGSFSYRISKDVLGKDLVINIPVMKTHSQTGISGAIANMARIADTGTQKEMAKAETDKHLASINSAVKYITVADCSIGMQANGPFITGEPAYLNLIMASRDPVAIDAVFCEMAFFEIPSHVKAASDAGLGNYDIEAIEIAGYEIEAAKVELKKAGNLSPNPNINVIDGKAWAGEYHMLYSLIGKFNNINVNRANIAVGCQLSPEQLQKKRLIAFGEMAITRLKELGIEPMAAIKSDNAAEAYVLLRKLLESEGESGLNFMDHARSKITSLMKK